jgi:transposase
MASLSQDLREKIIQVWEAGEQTRAEIARRFIVSEGRVKKLIARRNGWATSERSMSGWGARRSSGSLSEGSCWNG